MRALSYIGAEKITFPPKPDKQTDIHTYRRTDISVYRVASLLKTMHIYILRIIIHFSLLWCYPKRGLKKKGGKNNKFQKNWYRLLEIFLNVDEGLCSKALGCCLSVKSYLTLTFTDMCSPSWTISLNQIIGSGALSGLMLDLEILK